MLANAYAPPGTPLEDITHVFNVETVLDPQNPVSGSYAELVYHVQDRGLWYPCGTLVVPKAVDPEYRAYVESFGKETAVVVPSGIDHQSLSILDGKDDAAFQAAVGGGRWVESYVIRPEMRTLVEANGGCYFVKQEDGVVERIADKTRYRELMEGVVDVPEGVVAEGIDDITNAVEARLAHEGKAFVRLGISGGGKGNRRFDLSKSGPMTRQQIREKLQGDQPEVWENGRALVEKYLDIAYSPAVGLGGTYSNLQITVESEYVGSILPVPPEICQPEHLAWIGIESQKRAQTIGYEGPGNNDLVILPDGSTVGMEINAPRFTAVYHALEIAKRTLQSPPHMWAREGHVIKTLDHFALAGEMSFSELRATLGKAGLLASLKSPYGVIITIAPHGTDAGIQIQENGYKRTEGLYQEVLQLVGNLGRNRHDHPYIPTK